MTLRFCITGLQRAGATFTGELLADCRAHGDAVQPAPCLDRCAECERGFVAVIDGAAVAAPSPAAFLAELRALREP